MERFKTAAARAINALPRAEADDFDRAAKDDPLLQSHLDSHRAVAAELAESFSEIVPAASSDIWDRIVAETGIDRNHQLEPIREPSRTPSRLLVFAVVAAALVIGIVTGNLTSTNLNLRII